MNTWAFTGRVRAATSRATTGGKTVWQLVIAAKYQEKETLCVCDWWADHAPPIDAAVFASGIVTAREYQGKHYAGLTAREIHLFAAAADKAAAAQPAPQPAAPSPAQPEPQDDIPF